MSEARRGDPTSDFDRHRTHLMGVAYRMLGSVAEAEDVVQDVYLRWREVDHDGVADARAYLVTITSRLALDRLTSARARREVYVGSWLPEPLVLDRSASPEMVAELADDLSMALMMTLERLSPLERAAFLLHDIFDQDFAVVAATLGRSEAACRQLAARARTHVREPRVEAASAASDAATLAEAFRVAALDGDLARLASLLAEDAVFYTDGGGKRLAALNPIYGRDKILRFMIGTAHKRDAVTPDRLRTAIINGAPGFLVRDSDGQIETISLQIEAGQVVALYAVRNPDKLGHITWPDDV